MYRLLATVDPQLLQHVVVCRCIFQQGMQHRNHDYIRTSTLHVDLGVHKHTSAQCTVQSQWACLQCKLYSEAWTASFNSLAVQISRMGNESEVTQQQIDFPLKKRVEVIHCCEGWSQWQPDEKFSTRMTCCRSNMYLFINLKSIYSAQNLHALHCLRTIL